MVAVVVFQHLSRNSFVQKRKAGKAKMEISSKKLFIHFQETGERGIEKVELERERERELG